MDEYTLVVMEEERFVVVYAEDCEIIVPGEWRIIEVQGHGTVR
jgi:hypothetical protein